MPTPIQTFTPIHSWVASSNVSSLSFSSINQSYDHLVITGSFTRNIAGDFGGRSAQFQWNGVTSGYKSVYIAANQNTTTAGSGFGSNNNSGPNFNAPNNNAQGRNAQECWIPYYSSTTFQKHALMFKWTNDSNANAGGAMIVEDNLIPISGALTSLYIFEVSETFIPGDWITIYGVKSA